MKKRIAYANVNHKHSIVAISSDDIVPVRQLLTLADGSVWLLAAGAPQWQPSDFVTVSRVYKDPAAQIHVLANERTEERVDGRFMCNRSVPAVCQELPEE
jgi:hypothetical protein